MQWKRRSLWIVVVMGLVGCSGSNGELADTEGGSGETSATDGGTTQSASTADSLSQGGSTVADATGDSVGSSSGSAESGPSTTGGNGASTGSSLECPADPLPSGLHEGLELEWDGMTRTYDVYVPAGLDPEVPAPVVLNFHGYTSNSGQQAFFSGMNQDADARGMIVVYPQGFMNSWNAGPCCGAAMDGELDDVGFVRALLEALPAQVCLDPDRVYATGMSNGGFMSHRLACEAADVIAAIGPVAGPMGLPPESCQPARPIPIIHFHGTADTLVPYDGSDLLGFPPIVEMSQDWAARNGCDPKSTVSLQMDDVLCQTWEGCDEDVSVTLCTLDGFGHCWPGNPFCPSGQSSETISANQMMLDLFEQHSL